MFVSAHSVGESHRYNLYRVEMEFLSTVVPFVPVRNHNRPQMQSEGIA